MYRYVGREGAGGSSPHRLIVGDFAELYEDICKELGEPPMLRGGAAAAAPAVLDRLVEWPHCRLADCKQHGRRAKIDRFGVPFHAVDCAASRIVEGAIPQVGGRAVGDWDSVWPFDRLAEGVQHLLRDWIVSALFYHAR